MKRPYGLSVGKIAKQIRWVSDRSPAVDQLELLSDNNISNTAITVNTNVMTACYIYIHTHTHTYLKNKTNFVTWNFGITEKQVET